ncbi:hypothetical protein C0989_003175 [Termitomyces sp. Mn162]|nr:hypothetical protein C0989_003175 [Termitomyces sp. Mn162]
MFQAKPITFQLESSQVAFSASYLQGITFNHYTALFQFDPNNPVLSNWLAFTQIFSNQSKNMALWTLWNTFGNPNWQARATNSTRSSILTNPTNPAPHFPQSQETTNTNRLPGQCPPAQLNAADLHKTLELLDADPDDHDNILDSTKDQEVL